MAYEPRLKKEYKEKIQKELAQELGIKNVMAVPTITKIVLNSGLGEAKNDASIIESMATDLGLIAGQKPQVTQTKKAISNFKIRIGQDIGLKVTLRGDRMWEFLDRLVSVVLPRMKDFRGVSPKAFDGKGNYALGMKEHTVFPEIDTNKVIKSRGMQIIISTSANDDEGGRMLLAKLGMPFRK